MSLKHGLLGLLSCEGSMTGYELDKLFKNSLAYFWHAKTSHIYRELAAMEELGWLTSERVMQQEKPNKRVYSITEEGKAELHGWLLSPFEFPGGSKSTFLMRLFFSAEVGKEQALKLLREFRGIVSSFGGNFDEIRKNIEEDEADYPEHAIYWKLTALHGEIQYKYLMEWADKAITILEEESP